MMIENHVYGDLPPAYCEECGRKLVGFESIICRDCGE